MFLSHEWPLLQISPLHFEIEEYPFSYSRGISLKSSKRSRESILSNIYILMKRRGMGSPMSEISSWASIWKRNISPGLSIRRMESYEDSGPVHPSHFSNLCKNISGSSMINAIYDISSHELRISYFSTILLGVSYQESGRRPWISRVASLSMRSLVHFSLSVRTADIVLTGSSVRATRREYQSFWEN